MPCRPRPPVMPSGPARVRVVSLVPSLTEAVAVTVPGALVGATDWCSHPPDLDVVRVGGTKNPAVDRIVRLAPDLVIANEEENREPDLATLREARVEVLLTELRGVPGAFRHPTRVLDASGPRPPSSWCCPTSRTASPPTTDPRRSRGCPARSSTAGC